MSIVSGIFSRHDTKRAIIRRKTQKLVNGVKGQITYPRGKTEKGMYWKGSISKKFISEKLAPDVSGVVLFDPINMSVSDIPSADCRIDICDLDYGANVNNAGGYLAGVKTIAIDGYIVPPKKGDMFYIVGETGSVEHEIVAATSTMISFTPATASAIADDTLINITPIDYRLSVIQADDVALQNEVIVVPVKEFI